MGKIVTQESDAVRDRDLLGIGGGGVVVIKNHSPDNFCVLCRFRVVDRC